MNEKITEEEFAIFKPLDVKLVGSKAMGISHSHSDTDLVWIVANTAPLKHDTTYQYTDGQGNDYLIVTVDRFNTARADGSDIVLYEAEPIQPNYEILKAYLGLAKRDWTYFKKTGDMKKKFHAVRCYYIACDLVMFEGKDPGSILRMATSAAQADFERIVGDKFLDHLQEQRQELNEKYGKV